jgi:hypothetical protein
VREETGLAASPALPYTLKLEGRGVIDGIETFAAAARAAFAATGTTSAQNDGGLQPRKQRVPARESAIWVAQFDSPGSPGWRLDRSAGRERGRFAGRHLGY